jgi:uncharacterized protein (TIGR00266 family)
MRNWPWHYLESSLQYEIQHLQSDSLLKITLAKGESFQAAAGSLLAKTDKVTLSGTVEGGPLKALKRAILGGEKLFSITVEASDHGEATLAPALPGQILVLELESGDEYFMQGGHFLAAIGEVDLETVAQQVPPGLLNGEGLFVLRAKGRGALAVSAFGGLHEVTVEPGCDYLVDNGHLVAWSAPNDFKMERSGHGWLSTLVSGEGFLWRFAGPAKLWLQRRNPHAFSQWIKHLSP